MFAVTTTGIVTPVIDPVVKAVTDAAKNSRIYVRSTRV